MLNPEYSGKTRWVSLLLIPWLLVPPIHQQVTVLTHRINVFHKERFSLPVPSMFWEIVEKAFFITIPKINWTRQGFSWFHYFDGLVQERRNSIVNALELRLSCTNLSICPCLLQLMPRPYTSGPMPCCLPASGILTSRWEQSRDNTLITQCKTAVPADTRRNNNVIMTSERCRFDVMMTLFLRCVAVGVSPVR